MALKHHSIRPEDHYTLITIANGGTGSTFRPHSHCPSCWGEEFTIRDGVQVCTRCKASPQMIVCTPEVCASS